jgi:hypothetical protein
MKYLELNREKKPITCSRAIASGRRNGSWNYGSVVASKDSATSESLQRKSSKAVKEAWG